MYTMGTIVKSSVLYIARRVVGLKNSHHKKKNCHYAWYAFITYIAFTVWIICRGFLSHLSILWNLLFVDIWYLYPLRMSSVNRAQIGSNRSQQTEEQPVNGAPWATPSLWSCCSHCAVRTVIAVQVSLLIPTPAPLTHQLREGASVSLPMKWAVLILPILFIL